MDGWTIMTWNYNQESVYFCRWTECRHRCFESSVAILLPQLLYYSPSVEEWYHQMRSSLYLFSLLFSLTDTDTILQKLHVHQSQLNISLKAYDLVRSLALHHFVFVDCLDPDIEQKSHHQCFPAFPAFLPVGLPLFILLSFSNSFVWTVQTLIFWFYLLSRHSSIQDTRALYTLKCKRITDSPSCAAKTPLAAFWILSKLP